MFRVGFQGKGSAARFSSGFRIYIHSYVMRFSLSLSLFPWPAVVVLFAGVLAGTPAAALSPGTVSVLRDAKWDVASPKHHEKLKVTDSVSASVH